MSRGSVDWMSVANGGKNLVEELDHASPPSSAEVRRLNYSHVISAKVV
jgi:hypothetical protein